MSLPPDSPAPPRSVAIVGAGPAGLIAAERLAGAGVAVDVYDAMPSVGRKFLLAGRGGLNITHSEPSEAFLERYGSARAWLEPMLAAFGAGAIRDWVHALGIETFVGTSGRVFPQGMKAAPLLRAWLHRLRTQGVRFHQRHRWNGALDRPADAWRLGFDAPGGEVEARADAVVLALGGASWARLGSDGAWVSALQARGVTVSPLKPANVGFDADWSVFLAERFAGAAVKSVAARTDPSQPWRQGEFVVTGTGVEGSLVYALAPGLRDRLDAGDDAVLWLDLLPDRSEARVCAELERPRGSRSLANHLRQRLGITGVKAALLHECAPKASLNDPRALAALIKALPVRLRRTRPLDEAISTAGGVPREALDDALMLRPLPGVFCAGEMLDWEAPTGGYLLTACWATGAWAAQGVRRWLDTPHCSPGAGET